MVESVTIVDGRTVAGATKSGQGRVVTLTGSVADDIIAHLKDYPPEGGLVFPAPSGGYLNRHNFHGRVWLQLSSARAYPILNRAFTIYSTPPSPSRLHQERTSSRYKPAPVAPASR